MRNLKALGVFGGSARPSWAVFQGLAHWDDFAQAAEDSRLTGVRWVLQIMTPHSQPLADVMPDLLARLESSGLRPYILAVTYREEWYGAWKSGELQIPGLDRANLSHWPIAAQAIAGWCGQQHAEIRKALPGVPVLWLDGYVNDDLSFGGQWYQPVPAGVDALALEAYVPAGGSWAQDVEVFLDHAVSTREEPIVLVAQGFQDEKPGGMWSDGPTEESIRETERWMDHDRVIGAWVFTWASRTGCIGLADLPARVAFEQALGVA